MESKVLIKTQKVNVDGNGINFTESHLEGFRPEHTLLLLPGSLGSGPTDYNHQIINLPKILPNHRIIAWDPPGLGKSIPPKRNFTVDLLFNDAEVLKKFIDKLNVDKVSMLGYSAGAVTAYIYASKNPENVNKLILISPASFVSDDQIKYFQSIRDVSKWPPKMREEPEKEYGIEYLKYLWEGFVDTNLDLKKKFTKEFMTPIIKNIKAETLIFYGEKDSFIDCKNDIEYLLENVQRSNLISYPKGTHKLQNQMPDEINRKIGYFLMTRNKM